MTTFHAVIWMDHTEAHAVMFDREHMEAQRIKSRSHHKHAGKADDYVSFFSEIAKAVEACHEVLLTGPGLARNQFRDWCNKHNPVAAGRIVNSIAADHPTDAQLVAQARQYFKKFDAMAADPSLA